MGSTAYRGRFAPSPTGDLHLGSAATALVAWLSARAAGRGLVRRGAGPRPPRRAADRAGVPRARLGRGARRRRSERALPAVRTGRPIRSGAGNARTPRPPLLLRLLARRDRPRGECAASRGGGPTLHP